MIEYRDEEKERKKNKKANMKGTMKRIEAKEIVMRNAETNTVEIIMFQGEYSTDEYSEMNTAKM